MASDKRDLKIDTLKGIVIILMVIAHVIGTTANDGLKVAEDSIYRWFYCLTENYFLPIFMSISGYLYATKPMSRENVKIFIDSKIIRLIYPLIIVSTIQFLVRYFTPGTNNKPILSDIWKIYIYSYDQFWYIQSFILILVLVVILEYFKLISSKLKVSICFFILFLLPTVFTYRTTLFSFCGFLYLSSFFIFGIIIYRYKDIMKRNGIKIAVALLFLMTIGIEQYIFFNKNISMDRTDLLGMLFGIIGVMFSFIYIRERKYIAWIGSYSYYIYLFHVFGQAGSRIIFKTTIGIKNDFLLFLIGVSFGIMIPILITKIAIKSNMTKKYLLGLK